MDMNRVTSSREDQVGVNPLLINFMSMPGESHWLVDNAKCS